MIQRTNSLSDMLIAKYVVFPSTSIPKAIHIKKCFANMIFATMKQSAFLSSNTGRVSSKDGTTGNGDILNFPIVKRHIKNIVVGSLENELIFQKFFGIIIIQEKKKIFSPFFKVPIFSGGIPRSAPFSAGVVHRLVRLPSFRTS